MLNASATWYVGRQYFVEKEPRMKTKVITSFALGVGLLAACGPMFAHHGSVAYDNSKVVVLKQATVTKVNWANPHILVLFDVKDDKGTVRHWTVEGGGPSAVSGSGWTKDAVQPGDVITVYLYQAKNGAPVGRTGKLVLANGKALGGGGEVTSPSQVPALGANRPSQCDKDFGPGGNEAAACRPDGRKTSSAEK
jgi:Family of unknown function (DUF6152)